MCQQLMGIGLKGTIIIKMKISGKNPFPKAFRRKKARGNEHPKLETVSGWNSSIRVRKDGCMKDSNFL
jgi:hypothetical protein